MSRFGRCILSIALACATLPRVVQSQPNTWTNSAAGKWEDGANWLQGTPSSTQSALLITNAGSKTVTIDAATTNSSTSLVISNLTIRASSGSTNTLSMTDAGTNVALHILNSLTITNGGAVSITNSVLRVDGPLGINGDVTLQPGAQVIATNAFTSIGFSLGATGQVTMTGGAATFGRFIVGSNSFSVGTFTVSAANLVISNQLNIALNTNSVGSVWIKGGDFFAPTVSVASRLNAKGQLVFSNAMGRLNALLMTSSAGSEGTFTMIGSTVTISVAGGIGLSAGFGSNRSTGTVFVSDGQLMMTNSSLDIGSQAGVGRMTITNSSVLASVLYVGLGNDAQGTLTAISSSLIISNYVQISGSAGATGTVWLSDSQLQLFATTNAIFVQGVGQMTSSNNSTVSVGSAWLGRGGTITIQSGTMSIASNFFIVDSSFSTGVVWISSGQITVSNGVMTMGQVTISNGLVSVWDATVASTTASSVVSVADSAGTLTIVGGSFCASSSLILGKCASNALGQITVSGGQLCVTNATQTGYLDLRGGTLTISGGSVVVDRFIMTNSCAQFIRAGGTLLYGVAVLDPNRDDDDDGIQNGYEQSHGLDPLNAADANVDSDGDGFTNLQEFQIGTDPTNNTSAFRILGVEATNDDVLVTWSTAGGRTNMVQSATDLAGSYTNVSLNVILPGSGDTTTNYLDAGAATNAAERFYRIRVVP